MPELLGLVEEDSEEGSGSGPGVGSEEGSWLEEGLCEELEELGLEELLLGSWDSLEGVSDVSAAEDWLDAGSLLEDSAGGLSSPQAERDNSKTPINANSGRFFIYMPPRGMEILYMRTLFACYYVRLVLLKSAQFDEKTFKTQHKSLFLQAFMLCVSDRREQGPRLARRQ